MAMLLYNTVLDLTLLVLFPALKTHAFPFLAVKKILISVTRKISSGMVSLLALHLGVVTFPCFVNWGAGIGRREFSYQRDLWKQGWDWWRRIGLRIANWTKWKGRRERESCSWHTFAMSWISCMTKCTVIWPERWKEGIMKLALTHLQWIKNPAWRKFLQLLDWRGVKEAIIKQDIKEEVVLLAKVTHSESQCLKWKERRECCQ